MEEAALKHVSPPEFSRCGKVGRRVHSEIPLFPLTLRETPAQVPDPASKEEPQDPLGGPLPSRPEPGPRGLGEGLRPLWGRAQPAHALGWAVGLPFCPFAGSRAPGCCPHSADLEFTMSLHCQMSGTWGQQHALLCRPSQWPRGSSALSLWGDPCLRVCFQPSRVTEESTDFKRSPG